MSLKHIDSLMINENAFAALHYKDIKLLRNKVCVPK